MIVLPEHNMAFAVVMSGGSSLFGQAMGQSLLLQALPAAGRIPEIIPPQEITPPIASEMPSELTEYAGICANNSIVGRIAISPAGELTLTPLAWVPETGADRPGETYFYTSDGEFVSEKGDKRLTFVEESNRKTYTRLVQSYILPGLGQVEGEFGGCIGLCCLSSVARGRQRCCSGGDCRGC
jgi:hypothetical protein